MRLLQTVLAAFGGGLIPLVFAFWSLFIWEGDHRWGETAGLLFVASIVCFIGSALASLGRK
jgi:hypothetical protein